MNKQKRQLWRRETKSTALVENYREEISVNRNNLFSILDRVNILKYYYYYLLLLLLLLL